MTASEKKLSSLESDQKSAEHISDKYFKDSKVILIQHGKI